jgi:hypothetical protein
MEWSERVAYVDVPGEGWWCPRLDSGYISQSPAQTTTDAMTLDADEEEAQYIGRIHLDGGATGKTFGTSGSKVGWLSGASITFQAAATLRVGVKKAASIDATTGPAARATIGAAAFDVYNDLIGGTDTISSTTWRNDAMSAGTPFTVNDGDLIAVCFHLDIVSAAQSVKIRSQSTASATVFPVSTLVTSGPTYAAQTAYPNIVLTFNDGTIGWLTGPVLSNVFTAATTIGNTNIGANIFQFPFACKIDAIAAQMLLNTNTANVAFDIYTTPLGTPVQAYTQAEDANITATVTGNRMYFHPMTSRFTMAANTAYAVGVRQTTANAVNLNQYDVDVATYFRPNGMDENTYAVLSTAGATFAAQNSGKRRFSVWVKVCAIDIPAGGGGGGLKLAGRGGLAG